jgi:Mg-chelatase subunit ChlD
LSELLTEVIIGKIRNVENIMTQLMRCPFCGLLQDEPAGVKECSRCGGGLEYENIQPGKPAYLQVQMELDQISAPVSQNLERYLLVTIHAPKEVPREENVPTEVGRPALNFVAVLDVSGSMQGEKIDQAKLAVQRAVQFLRDDDAFSLVAFASAVGIPFEPSIINRETYQVVEKTLRHTRAGGMTALDGGLQTGIEKAALLPRESNLVLLLSDGQANVGETDLEKIGQRAFLARQQGELISCLGIGLDYNEALLAEIATQGGGRFYHLQNASQIPAYLAGELGEVAMLAARDVKIHLTLPDGITLIPLSAAYPVKQAGGQAIITVGDIPCDVDLEIPLRLAILAQPNGSKLSIFGRLDFRSPASHDIECPVNRVTVRFVDQSAFELRQGVVQPTAERVFAQLRATNVLEISRILVTSPQDAEQKAQTILSRLHAYADLLGKERAVEEMNAVNEQFASLRNSPAAAKQTVANAYHFIRPSRDFDH